MPTLVLDPQPAAIEELLAQRARLDLDRRDEVWDGVLHMIPPPSYEHERLLTKLVRLLGPLADAAGLELVGGIGIGEGKDEYRVPDLSLHRPAAVQPQWNPRPRWRSRSSPRATRPGTSSRFTPPTTSTSC